ncbi:hypothetical protein JTE90_003480 [Oedothorax gibbosus]|uniref:Uncharacterized protein n=1 Tax=Oedothorax gibbosus TaxID=931172 RepID=A0AAV6UF57_9ARAC|nr:hypothetical protein JTE90_003480 [Oedothorax gibbosus]
MGERDNLACELFMGYWWKSAFTFSPGGIFTPLPIFLISTSTRETEWSSTSLQSHLVVAKLPSPSQFNLDQLKATTKLHHSTHCLTQTSNPSLASPDQPLDDHPNLNRRCSSSSTDRLDFR